MDRETVCRALARGDVLLTANQRLSRHWRGRYDRWEQARDAAHAGVWASAAALPLDAWVRRRYEEALDRAALGLGGAPDALAEGGLAQGGLLLSEGQAGYLWERLVERDPLASGLLRTQALARTAREAWRRLADWRLPVPAPGPGAPAEQQAFAAWAAAYGERCEREGWADPALLSDRITAALRAGALRAGALRAGALPVPPRVLLAGFERPPPRQQALLDALAAAGCALTHLPPPHHDGRPVRTSAPDAEAEAWAAARWARRRLEAAPAARIGIVLPDLTDRREQLERALEDVLTPGALLSGQGEPERPFNLSVGLPLARQPLIATALRLLALTPAAQPLEELSALLRSPFLAGGESERAARALLDLRLRGWGSLAIEPSRVRAAAAGGESADGGDDPAHAAPELVRGLTAWRAAWDALPARQAPSAWAVAFAALPRALGWPGQRTLDSAEYQACEAWSEQLDALAALDAVAPLLSHGEALAALRRAVGDAVWQPEGGDAPVQVLGMLESDGLAFDHLWVLGAHEEAWPWAARPNPFLPVALQRAHGMPRASAETELAFARQATDRLCTAAPEVVFSHAALEGDRTLRPSPLIAGLPLEALAELAPAGASLRERIGAAAALERFDDAQAPALAPGTAVRGGTALFQDQAACPFRAFARHRLHARPPEVPGAGLDPAARGSLVHLALEAFWRRVPDHASLLALDDAALEHTLAESASAAVASFAERQRGRIGARQEGLERTRLAGLLRDWLALERERAPFAVAALEQRQELTVGGITVTGRADRIDRLPDGRAVLIDYKTGLTNVRAWWGARPDEPQLPLYALAMDDPPAGVAFAQLRRQALGFRGIAEDPTLFPNATRVDDLKAPELPQPPASLAEATALWRTALEGLAEAYRLGDARVAPKDAQTCRYCELPGLCRIAELAGPVAEAEAEDDGAGDGAGDEGGAGDG